MNLRKYLLAVLLFLCVGCTHKSQDFPEEVFNEVVISETRDPTEVIALQNLRSRVLVYCYNGVGISAQECAQKFESEGYVRLKDIPRFPAQYDFLKDGSYPSRRWRNDELVPRW